MSMWADFVSERRGAKVQETEYGFASYYITPPTAYLEDVYIKPSKRLNGLGRKFVREVAREALGEGCNTMYTTVDITANGCTESLTAILQCGFRLSKLSGSAIILEIPLEA